MNCLFSQEQAEEIYSERAQRRLLRLDQAPHRHPLRILLRPLLRIESEVLLPLQICFNERWYNK